MPVVQQQRRYRAQDQQQPEGADQSLAGQSEVPGALLEGDGGGGPMAIMAARPMSTMMTG